MTSRPSTLQVGKAEEGSLERKQHLPMQGALKVSPRLGLGVEGGFLPGEFGLGSAEGGGGLNEARASGNSDIRLSVLMYSQE